MGRRAIRQAVRDKLVRVVRDALAEDLAEQRRAVLDELRGVEVRARRDIFAAAEREAVASSARYAYEAMPTVPTFPHKHDTLRHALGLAVGDGLALEFGVFSGSTLRIIAEARGGRDVHGFDSFEGLPEDWRSGFPAGAFGTDARGNPLPVPDVPGAQLVVGWFDETLPGFLAEHDGPVSFLHVDCDLYSSTVTVLEQVGPRLRPGSIVVFDEYFNYPGWEGGEFRAWQEYCAKHGLEYAYEGYTLADEQVIVRLLG